ncbi:unnamed protein product, partial [Brenthis ino]
MKREDNYQKYATDVYDPIKIGSIDCTDTEPHDRAILRALCSEYVPNKKVKGDPYHTVFIARLNPRTTQDTIYAEFLKFGKILNCRLVRDIVTEREAERRLQGWKPRRLGGGLGGCKESGQLRFGCRDRPFRKPILIAPKSIKEESSRK